MKTFANKKHINKLMVRTLAACMCFLFAPTALADLDCNVGEFKPNIRNFVAKNIDVTNMGDALIDTINITLTVDRSVVPVKNWGDVDDEMHAVGTSVEFKATDLLPGERLSFGFKGETDGEASYVTCTATGNGDTPAPTLPPTPSPTATSVPSPTPVPSPISPPTPLPSPGDTGDKCPDDSTGSLLVQNWEAFALGAPPINADREFREQFCSYPYTIDGFGAEDERSNDADALARAEAGEKAGPQDFVRVEIVQDENAFQGQSLRVMYPDGGVTPSHSGFQYPEHVPSTPVYDRDTGQFSHGHLLREVYLSYWVKFEDDFTFQLGGKLPGFYASRGYRDPEGDRRVNARMMWREEGKLEFYIHADGLSYTDADGEFATSDKIHWRNGADINGHAALTIGEWQHIEYRIKLNDVVNGNAINNGELEGWLNGAHAALYTDVIFTNVPDANFNTFFFSTFFGGSGGDGSKVWWPLKDVYAVFDNIKVSETRVGCCDR